MLSESARLLASLDSSGSQAKSGGLTGELLQRLEHSASILHSAIRAAVGPQDETSSKSIELTSSWIESGLDGIRGHSRAVTVPELLSFICSSAKSGVLSIRSTTESFLVQLDRGRVVCARGDRTPKNERLGQLLLRAGALQAEELERTVTRGSGRGVRLGDLLVKMGLITEEDLRVALLEQMQLLFHRLCKPGEKSFRFFEGLRIEKRPLVRQRVTPLLLESTRHWDEVGYAGFAPIEEAPRVVNEAPNRTIEDHLSHELAKGKLKLPLLDNAAIELLALSWDEDVDAERLDTLILRDPGLCAHILRIANSVTFAPTVKISSVRLAVARLGIDNIREIALAMTLKQQAFGATNHKEELRAMWRSSLITSEISKALSQGLRLGTQRGGLSGLLQDIGRPVVLNLIAEYQEQAGLEIAPADIDALVDTYHSRVGGRLIEDWHLPTLLRQVVLHHHDPSGAEEFHSEVRVAYLADRLAREFDVAEHQSDYDPVPHLIADANCAVLGLSEEQLRGVWEQRERILEAAEMTE